MVTIQNKKTLNPAAAAAKNVLQNKLKQTAQKNTNASLNTNTTLPKNNVTTNKPNIPSPTNQSKTNFNTNLTQNNAQTQTVDPRWVSNQTVPDYLGMTSNMIQNALNGFTGGSQYYNPEEDPVYQSMLTLSQKQADKAGLQAMELLNERGILNSAVTTDRLGQIKQGASDSVLASIPSLANAFNSKQAQNAAGLQNLLNSVLNAGQFQQTFAEDNRRYDTDFAEDTRRYDLEFGENNRRYDKQFALDESAVTGKYLSPEAQQAIQTVLNAKQIRENKSNPLDQREQAHTDATAARQLLASMGVDISTLGADSSYRQALNSLNSLGGGGITTLNNKQQQANNALAVGEMTGKYTPAGASDLVTELLRLKQENEKGGINKVERQSNTSRATQIRNQLSSLGVNADSLFGAGIGAQQAAANASRMASQTEASRQFDKQLAYKQNEFDKQLAFDQSSFDRKMNFEEQNALIKADLEARGLDLESMKLQISQFSSQSDADYQQTLKDLKINESTAKQNTNAAIGEALKAVNEAEAIAFIAEASADWAQQGVDMKEVLSALQYKFPNIKNTTGTSSNTTTNNSIYNTSP